MSEIIERYEFKYLVPQRLIPAIRQTALSTSRIDRYADADGTYLIRSLYFDNAQHDLYWANQHEKADRFKLRARMYPGKVSPVFLEVKRRVKDVIVKSRAAVPADSWQKLLQGDSATLAQLPEKTQSAVQAFVARYLRHNLQPMLLVDYEREAYVSDIDTYARLTFDRKIMVQPKDTLDFEPNPTTWRHIDHPEQTQTFEPVTVLELKFERRPPSWMTSMIRRLELQRLSYSKYCYGVNATLSLPLQRDFAY